MSQKRVLIIVMINDLALLRLLQLVSPGLPIGMYSYSQGLERAIDDGLVGVGVGLMTLRLLVQSHVGRIMDLINP